MSSYTVDEFNTEIQTINQSLNATNYVWNFGDGYSSTQIQPTHIYNDADATYNVELTAYNEVGCFDIAVVSVSSIQSLVVYVPNTFTPNEDEYNQVFKPIISGAYKPNSYHLTVFNRWGEIVFESYDPNYGWDGMYGDQRCQFGTYTWKLSLDALQSGETKNYHGHVTLLR
jgi:gliding motility-associated-like protein